MSLCFDKPLPGGNDPQEHSEACDRSPFPCPDRLQLWTSHEKRGEEADGRL